MGLSAVSQTPLGLELRIQDAYPQLGITGAVGTVCEIQYANDLTLAQPWVPLTNLVLSTSPYLWVDRTGSAPGQRFYRAVDLELSVVFVPEGPFRMGDTFGEGYPDERPVHTAYISAFYMDRSEVSKGLWDAVVAWSRDHGYSYDYPGSGKAPSHPVHTVSWYDALKWCNARSEKEGLTPVYYTDAELTQTYRTSHAAPQVLWSAPGYRLPTEAEWEKAARGGSGDHRFPWTDADTITHSRANYYSAGLSRYDVSPTPGYHPAYDDGVTPFTSPVGSFAANGYGLYDVAGNVLEWCWDWFEADWYGTAGATQDNTPGPAGPLDYRVLRGGSWFSYAMGNRCAARIEGTPSNGSYNAGFRCVRRP